MGRCARGNKTEDVISLISYMTYHMPQDIEKTIQSYIFTVFVYCMSLQEQKYYFRPYIHVKHLI